MLFLRFVFERVAYCLSEEGTFGNALQLNKYHWKEKES